MEKNKKLPKGQRATEDDAEIRAILIGMPRAHLAQVAQQFAVLGHHTLSPDDQFKIRCLELPKYEYGSQPLPTLVAGPGVDLTSVLPIELLMKVLEYIPPLDCLRLSESSKFFHEIMKEESFWNSYCNKLLKSTFFDDYKKILDANTLSSKRLALHIFGHRDPSVIYSDWESFQRLERSKYDGNLAREIKNEIKKKKFRKIVRFDTTFAQDFEIRLDSHDYVHYFFLVNLLEYDWQIEDEEGVKSYFERCAASIKKFCEKELEERRKLVPIKKQKIMTIECTVLLTGFGVFRRFGEGVLQGQDEFSPLHQISASFNSCDMGSSIRFRHFLELEEPYLVSAVYTTLIDCIEFSALIMKPYAKYK